jgi:hypothetical protein
MNYSFFITAETRRRREYIFITAETQRRGKYIISPPRLSASAVKYYLR